jgi:hypothetical protein
MKPKKIARKLIDIIVCVLIAITVFIGLLWWGLNAIFAAH